MEREVSSGDLWNTGLERFVSVVVVRVPKDTECYWLYDDHSILPFGIAMR